MPDHRDIFDFVQRGQRAQAAVDRILEEHRRRSEPPSADRQTAYNSGWNLGEMNGGVTLGPKLNPYPNNTPLNLAFAAGYAAGQADWLDKNAPSDDA